MACCRILPGSIVETAMRRTICSIGRSAILAGIAAGVLLLSAPAEFNLITPAAAQQSLPAGIAADFRTALEPYGSWRHHSRFGDIWAPRNVSRDWRPYVAGHWVYTDDYGWYWISDAQESDWGWVAYHYGRWYL